MSGVASIEIDVDKQVMKTFDKSIFPGTARLNIHRLDVHQPTPILDDLSDKLRAFSERI